MSTSSNASQDTPRWSQTAAVPPEPSTRASPLPLVLVGLLVSFFLLIEARRYRYFDISRAVQAKIAEFPNLLAPNEIRAQTLRRVVYLYGQVNTTVERNLAESAASQVEGVQRVVDSIALSDGGA